MTPAALRTIRRRLGLTQEAFAAAIGVASNTVSRWELGEIGMKPTTERLIRMVAKSLETSQPSPKAKRRTK